MIRQELYKLRNEYISLEAQADKCKELHALAYSGGGAMRYDKERVQTSVEDNSMSAVHRLVEAEQKMLSMLIAYKQHRLHMDKLIRPLPIDEYKIVREYFFEIKSFGQINPEESYKITKQKVYNAIRKLDNM